MGQRDVKPLKDEYGIIMDAVDELPEDLHEAFLKSVKELEDNNAHIKRQFPQTRLHKIEGTKKAIYRADVTKTSGWRIHLQYGDDNFIRLCDLVSGNQHDEALRVVQSKKERYK